MQKNQKVQFLIVKQVGFCVLISSCFSLNAYAAEMRPNDSNPLPVGQFVIKGEKTKYDSESCVLEVSGNAVLRIGGQDSRLEADKISYDRKSQVVTADKNVRIYRLRDLATGDRWRFRIDSPAYLITTFGTKIVEPSYWSPLPTLAVKSVGRYTKPQLHAVPNRAKLRLQGDYDPDFGKKLNPGGT